MRREPRGDAGESLRGRLRGALLRMPARRRRRPEVAAEAHPLHRSLRAGRPRRHHRAPDRLSAVERSRAASGGGEPARRGGQHRSGGGGEGAPPPGHPAPPHPPPPPPCPPPPPPRV